MGNAVSSSDSAEGNVNDDEIGEEDARVLPIAAAAAVSAIQKKNVLFEVATPLCRRTSKAFATAGMYDYFEEHRV